MRYPLSRIYLHVSDACNLNCRHCWIEPQPNSKASKLSIKDLQKALTEAKKIGLKHVKITGGEPFMYSEILNLIKLLTDNGLSYSMETNATLIADQEIKVLAECKPIDVSVSLDGSNETLHNSIRMHDNSFTMALEGIKRLKKNNICFNIIYSLWRNNKHDIKNTAALAKTLGAQGFKINPIMNLGRGSQMEDQGEILTTEELIFMRDEVNSISEELDFPIYYDIPPAFLPMTSFFASQGMCGIKNMLGILYDGSISICSIGKSLEDLILGHIRSDSIIDIWNNSVLLKDIRNNLPDSLKGVCAKCILKYKCLGKCRAQSYWHYNNLYEAHDFCNDANEKGIFPEELLL